MTTTITVQGQKLEVEKWQNSETYSYKIKQPERFEEITGIKLDKNLGTAYECPVCGEVHTNTELSAPDKEGYRYMSVKTKHHNALWRSKAYRPYYCSTECKVADQL